MGTLRYLLAIAVVFGHVVGAAPTGVLTDSITAVQAFYIVSGFLITYILNERYAKLSDFYRSRLLRIFPSYYFWLVATVVAFYYVGWSVKSITSLGELSPFAAAYVVVSNLIIVGQDWAFWLTYDANGHLHFVENFWHQKNQIYPYFVVTQAWSLSLELMFYAVAPWIVRRPLAILFVFIAAQIARYFSYRQFGIDDPYLYRFFPLEIGTFMMGAMSYYLLKWYRSVNLPARAGDLAALTICALALGFQWLPSSRSLVLFTDAQIIFYSALVLLLPLALLASSRHPIDRFIGELSYPIYLGHIGVIAVVTTSLPSLGKGWQAVVVVVVATVLAAGSYWLIDRPLDHLRHRKLSDSARPSQPGAHVVTG